ncbi:MAG: hypothetical protein JWO98_3495 [Frankiales bacterium]|nr:hypothetical protein [Frankiales bacterium]
MTSTACFPRGLKPARGSTAKPQVNVSPIPRGNVASAFPQPLVGPFRITAGQAFPQRSGKRWGNVPPDVSPRGCLYKRHTPPWGTSSAQAIRDGAR